MEHQKPIIIQRTYPHVLLLTCSGDPFYEGSGRLLLESMKLLAPTVHPKVILKVQIQKMGHFGWKGNWAFPPLMSTNASFKTRWSYICLTHLWIICCSWNSAVWCPVLISKLYESEWNVIMKSALNIVMGLMLKNAAAK